MVISPWRLIYPVLRQELWRVLVWPMSRCHIIPSGRLRVWDWKWPIEIIAWFTYSIFWMVIFRSYLNLPEGKPSFSYGCSRRFPIAFLYDVPMFLSFSHGFAMIFHFFYTTFWAWHIKAAWSPFPKIFVEPKGPPTSPCLREPPRERQGKLSKWQENASIKELVTVMAWNTSYVCTELTPFIKCIIHCM